MSNIPSELNESVPSESPQPASNEQVSQINDSKIENESTDDTSTARPNRPPGQTAIGAKLVKKLETLAATTKDTPPSNGKTGSTADGAIVAPKSSTDLEANGNVKKTPQDLLKTLTESDPQKNLMVLATVLAELQEQTRSTQAKITELEKRSNVSMRERDQALLDNDRVTNSKAKLESLCRELHRSNQQIRDESIQRQQDEDAKRQGLATKFQTTIDEITSQLANYSEKSVTLKDQNSELSEQLTSVMKGYDLREKEIEAALKKKELEVRLTKAGLEQSQGLLKERTELIKQEQQVTDAERLVLYKKCEELAGSEGNLRAQLTMYSERYEEFQKVIKQSSEMVTSCQTEIEKMKVKIQTLEQERNEYRQRWEAAEQGTKKTNEDMKVMEKEKRQLDIKLNKVDKLCRTLQEERSDLQAKVKSLTKTIPAAPEGFVETKQASNLYG